MFANTHGFSSFSVKDITEAELFYGNLLGLASEITRQGLALRLAGGGEVFVYEKPDHLPASFTVLNFPVDDIDQAVDRLTAKGVVFEHYTGAEMSTDAKGVARGIAANQGPDIAWFKDPSGNILSVLQNEGAHDEN